ncbi:hypothetical protein DPMN_062677 [Dreissena polymorpha]|uniref:BPTI/Kunitz inhibitor domain-containing protein n=1 Tax=Dreissena polymorpha TaxID=45954 RepID=A0A9D4CA82_DREPO|nr:hypothetical protein DPMN_062677 [Dreissena polymorpha]
MLQTATPAFPECRVVPSPGRCTEQERSNYFSYSTKTHTCTEIYGCYSLQDRNVFLTAIGCLRECLLGGSSGSQLDRRKG